MLLDSTQGHRETYFLQ